MPTLLQDLRYALRTLGRSPGFTLVAVLTLALGIGINTTVFSVVNTIALRPPPFIQSEGLAAVRSYNARSGGESSLTYPDFEEFRESTRTFQDVGAYYDDRRILGAAGSEPEQIEVEVITPNLFTLLGARAALGRVFTAADGTEARGNTVILAHQAWERRFQRDPRVVGATVTLDGVPHTVVGVMPRNFGFPDNQTFWVPMTKPATVERGSRYLSAVGRLNDGVTLRQGQAELAAFSREQARRFPDYNDGMELRAIDFREHWAGPAGSALWVMLGAVAFVLLIACANVANLLLARAAARRREIAVRVAMGAGRGRLVRQLLTESVLVALAGGALGIVFAMGGLRLILTAFPFQPPLWMVFDIDRNVLLFVLGVSLGTGILFGLAPALRATGGDLQATLRDGGRGSTTGARRARLHRALVVGELALAVVLLVGATLMIRSFLHLRTASPGFRAEGALAAQMSTGGERYAQGSVRAALYRQALERTRALPGVKSAGLVTALPMGGGVNTSGVDVEGRSVAPGDRINAERREVSEGFFEAMGVPVVSGRPITADEAARGAEVIVVSRTLAERLFPGQSALGRRITVGGPWLTIIGVAGDIHARNTGEAPRPQMYLPIGEEAGHSVSLVVRTSGDPAGVAKAVRESVRSIDPTVPVELNTMGELASRSLWQQRLFGGMFTSFALIALLLAVTGVYAMMAYAVSQRTHEIGVRMALGARAEGVLRMIVGQGLATAALGVGLGLAGAFAVTRVMAGMLSGVTPGDPLSFALVAAILGGVALLASYIPARRAARVDPMVALRSE
ncbi:MAG TPA: ABC transporter permease [Longimicrobium sp.]|jgi:predicted permease